MGQKSGPVKKPAEQVVKEIRRATRRQFTAEEKIRIVLSGLRGEDSIAELCRREGIVQNLYYRWSKEFLEAGKKRLPGDTARAATSDEVKDLRREAGALKEAVAELLLENQRRRARSSGGIRLSKTASCWKTISCPAISKPKSRPSSTTTTTAATTRASTISPRPTSTSDAAQPSWPNEKGSSDRPLLIAACSTGCRLPDFTNPMSQSLP